MGARGTEGMGGLGTERGPTPSGKGGAARTPEAVIGEPGAPGAPANDARGLDGMGGGGGGLGSDVPAAGGLGSEPSPAGGLGTDAPPEVGSFGNEPAGSLAWGGSLTWGGTIATLVGGPSE